ncbi:MAG: MucR family transcriptional regulator [Pseudomonadota bacterium]
MTDRIFEKEDKTEDSDYILGLTSDVVASYVANNSVSTSELPEIINDVYSAFNKIAGDGSGAKRMVNLTPAVPVKKSLHNDFIICLEDGKQFKSLKRHLSSHYGLSPDEYREKWGLPPDYPMVAPSYAKARSRLAKEIGLGRKPGVKYRKSA